MARVRPWGVPTVKNLETAPTFLAYNHYHYQKTNGDVDLFCHGGLTVAEFVSKNPMVTIANGRTRKKMRRMLPGERDFTVHFRVGSDISKGVARQLILHIVDLEAKGLCLAFLTEDNVRISEDGTVTLRGVEILKHLDHDTFEAHLRNNYIAAADIIDGLYDGGNNIPEEISHLTNLMRNDFAARALFPIHAGLASKAKYAGIYKKVHDHIRDCLSPGDYNWILSTLVHLKRRWRRHVRKNRLLKETFDHPFGDYSVPAGYQNQRYLTDKQKKALEKIKIDPSTYNHPTLTRNDIDLIKVHNLVTFLRNHSAHRMAPFLDWVSMGRADYTAEEAELVAMLRFPELLPEMQYMLFDLDRQSLLDLNLAEYF